MDEEIIQGEFVFSNEETMLKSPDRAAQIGKYTCDICEDSFKNKFLLARHVDSHKFNNTSCKICKKIFDDYSHLASHKRTHHVLKKTTSSKVSPRRNRQTPMKKSLKHRCETCGKVFSMASLLDAHAKLHNKSPNVNKQITEYVTPSKFQLDLKCEGCDAKFTTCTGLFKHQVIEHGLETPDKTIAKKPATNSLHKPKAKHNGIPACPRLQKAFKELQSKLNNI